MFKDEISEWNHRQAPWMSFSNILSFVLLFLTVFLAIFLLFYNQITSRAMIMTPDIKDTPSASVLERLLTLETRETQIKAYEEKLKEQEDRLSEQEGRLSEQEDTIKTLLGVRTSITKELLDIFSESNLVLDIDNQTGAIRFSEGIFFDSNRDIIKTNGMEYLNEFIPLYMSILLSENNRDYLAEIIIEGHTDDVGSYIYNLDLSQRRAFAVARYIIEREIPDFSNREIIHQYLTANGRSFSQPVYINGLVDQQRSRRVEFKFRLKDEDMIQQMQSIFEGVQ